MLWSAFALGTRTESWFGHGCSGQRMLLEHEQHYGLGMDALVSVMLLEEEQTYWPSQYFVKVVSCRSARYTVRVSLTKTFFCILQKRRRADGTSTSKPSKMREILRAPINFGSGEDADFARLPSDWA